MIEQLVRARKAQKLSQGQIASMLKKPQQYVSRYELGERRLDIVEFLDVAQALKIDGLDLAAKGIQLEDR